MSAWRSVYWLAVLAVSIATLCFTARIWWAPRAATRALRRHDYNYREWRLSCLISRLLPPAVVIAATAVLLVASDISDLSLDAGAQGFVIGLVSGVLSNQLFEEIRAGGRAYWQQCHDSLRRVLPVYSGTNGRQDHAAECAVENCQALMFNERREYLFESKEARDSQLEAIFSAPAHPVNPSALEAKGKRDDEGGEDDRPSSTAQAQRENHVARYRDV
jgi:hypothetical protein